jgi:osmotically-inducible protein OsmY
MRNRNIYNEERGPWDHSNSDRYSSPYPGTAIGPGEERYQRNEQFSERLDDRRASNHFGKGPKGWKRSDRQIKEEVCEALYTSSAVDASDIEVKIDSGMVTLEGSVSDRSMKRMAERCLDQIQGIEDVHNRLSIK